MLVCNPMAISTPCYKVILVGEYGVGKSSLFRRFTDNSFTEDSGPQSTLGLDHCSKSYTFGSDEIKVELWDTAGIERFATMSSSYFQSACGAILCFSLDDRESFGLLSQHLLDTAMHSKNGKIFVCGNKTDLVRESDNFDKYVAEQDIEDFCESCGTAVSGSYRVSCKTGDSVQEMFNHIASVLYSNHYDKFDPSKIKVHQPMGEEVSKKCC